MSPDLKFVWKNGRFKVSFLNMNCLSLSFLYKNFYFMTVIFLVIDPDNPNK